MPKSIKKVYMDYASSALSVHANPGAIHEFGVREKNKLEVARKKVAGILNAHAHEIIFTSGATESNNLAILGLINAEKMKNFRGPRKGVSQTIANSSFFPHIVTTNIEHASVLEVCRHLEKTKQAEVTYVEVEANGVIDPKKIKQALQKNTVLVSVMYANNEIGTVQPIREIAKEIRHFSKLNSKKIFFHTDGVQAVNYLPISVPQLGVDMMSLNSAKIYGPKGVGALYVKKGTPLSSIMFGGEQEFGLRPGTENVALATGFAKALEATEAIKEKEVMRLIKLRDYFFGKLAKIWNQSFRAGLVGSGPEKIFDSKSLINGDIKNRLPNNINITIPNIPSDLLVIELSAKGIMASAKSACKAGDGKASHVIQAINPMAKDTDGSLRFSLGRETTKADIDYTLKMLFQILNKLKKWYN